MKKNVAFFADFIPTVDVKAGKPAKAYWFRDRQIPLQRQAYCKISGTNPLPRSVTCENTLRYYSIMILTVCPGTFGAHSIKSMRIVLTSFCTWRAFCVVE